MASALFAIEHPEYIACMSPDSPVGSSHSERRHTGPAQRILIADDERDTVQTLTALLELEGHVVTAAYTGKEVLQTMRIIRPDVLILDLSLPGLSGYAVAQVVRHSFVDLRRPLLIAISGMWRESADMRIANQVGFDHYLVKPCDPEKVTRFIKQGRPPAAA
jgi:CheY-like chemotaxis protein